MLEEIHTGSDDNDDNDINVETGHYYESVEEMVEDAQALNCDAVVNCTGLGASKICNDDQLVGGRGILHLYDRDTCIRRESTHEGEPLLHDANILTEDAPWGSEEAPCYLIARGDTIVVGGSYLEGDAEEGIRAEESRRLFRNARLVGIDTERSKPKGQWTGFRPYRPVSRCEIDQQQYSENAKVRVVHSYGYGGSGWTVYVGCAKEVTRLLGF
jgi:D-amino-acid oxidase